MTRGLDTRKRITIWALPRSTGQVTLARATLEFRNLTETAHPVALACVLFVRAIRKHKRCYCVTNVPVVR